MKTYYMGFSFETIQETNSRWTFTVFHASGNICDGGYSKTENGAERKARKLIKLFASY